MSIRRKIYINVILCLIIFLLSDYFIYPLVIKNGSYTKKNKHAALMLEQTQAQKNMLPHTPTPLSVSLKNQADYFNHTPLINLTHGKQEQIHHLNVWHESASFELSFNELLSLLDTYPFPIEAIEAKSQGEMIRLTVKFFTY